MLRKWIPAAIAMGFFFWGCATSYLPDRSQKPLLDADLAEVVADLPKPPGNIAVSSDQQVYFTFHPEADPAIRVAKLVKGRPMPFPDSGYQHRRGERPFFDTVLSLRIDRQNRLWTLDHGDFGRGQPRLLAFDIYTEEIVHQFDFPSRIAGFGSFLNDFQVSPAGDVIFIADTGAPVPVLGGSPAIIVYDVKKKSARRLLENHESVKASSHVLRIGAEDFSLLGVPILIAVDSIALDREGQCLYYGAVNGEHLYRIRTEYLMNPDLTAAELGFYVEKFAEKTMSDGLTIDLAGNIYISDMEHSAVHLMDPNRKLKTLLKDERFRWPDGFSFGPDGWLYFTCSDLMNVVGKRASHIEAHAPYRIFRFKPGNEGIPGH